MTPLGLPPAACARFLGVVTVACLTLILVVQSARDDPTLGVSGGVVSLRTPAHEEARGVSIWLSPGDRSAPLIAPTRREMWVWHFGNPSAVLAVAKRYAVTELLVWVSPGFTNDRALLRRLHVLSGLAQLAGMHLDALCGDPSWAASPAAATRWAVEVRSSQLFARIHVDIEPYARSDWSVRRSMLTRGLLSALREAERTGMPLDADIPSWYNTVPAPGGGSLDVAVMRLTSSVTIMAYRNSAAAVLALAEPELADAGRAHAKAWIGLNTAAAGGDPASTSYLGKSTAVIMSDIATLAANGTRWPSFSGLALHDSESLASLR